MVYLSDSYWRSNRNILAITMGSYSKCKAKDNVTNLRCILSKNGIIETAKLKLELIWYRNERCSTRNRSEDYHPSQNINVARNILIRCSQPDLFRLYEARDSPLLDLKSLNVMNLIINSFNSCFHIANLFLGSLWFPNQLRGLWSLRKIIRLEHST